MYSLYVYVLKSGLHTVYNIASYGDVGDKVRRARETKIGKCVPDANGREPGPRSSRILGGDRIIMMVTFREVDAWQQCRKLVTNINRPQHAPATSMKPL